MHVMLSVYLLSLHLIDARGLLKESHKTLEPHGDPHRCHSNE